MYERATFRSPEVHFAPPQPLSRQDAAMPSAGDILASLFRHRIAVGLCAAVGVVAALGFSVAAVPRYTATTQIIIDPTDLRIVDNSLRTSSTYGDAQIAQVEDQVRILTSTPVLQRVVESERLDQDSDFIGNGRLSLTRRLGAAVKSLLGTPAPADATTPEETAIRALGKAVSAVREERTFVVDVAVASPEAAKSARLADAVVAAFLDVSAEQRNEATRRVADSLKDRLGSLKKGVEDAEQRVVDYKKQNNLVAAVGQSVTEQQLASASSRLGDARALFAAAQSRYAQVVQAQRAGDAGAIPEAVQSSAVAALRTQLSDVVRQEGNLAATLGERHPEMAEMRAQERAVRASIHDEIARIAAVSKSNLERARADLQAAETAYTGLETNVTSKNELSVRLAELERDAQASRTVYESFLTRTREVGQQANLDTANVSVIAPAQVPETRSWPPRPALLLVAGLIVGLGLGAALALGRDFLLRGRRPSPGVAWLGLSRS